MPRAAAAARGALSVGRGAPEGGAAARGVLRDCITELCLGLPGLPLLSRAAAASCVGRVAIKALISTI